MASYSDKITFTQRQSNDDQTRKETKRNCHDRKKNCTLVFFYCPSNFPTFRTLFDGKRAPVKIKVPNTNSDNSLPRQGHEERNTFFSTFKHNRYKECKKNNVFSKTFRGILTFPPPYRYPVFYREF